MLIKFILDSVLVQDKTYDLAYPRLQTECSNYRMIAEEAYKQLMEIQSRDVLTQSMTLRLGDWLELMEEVRLILIILELTGV